MIDRTADLQHRLAKVQKAMAERGFGGVIAYYGAQHNMLRLDPILLLADYRVLGPTVLLIPKTGEPSLIITPSWDLDRARESVAFSNVRAVEELALAGAVSEAAKALPGPLALVGQDVMPRGFARELFAALGNNQPVDGGDIVKATAATRTDLEIERIVKAATIADAGFRCLQEVARPGMREYELAAEMDAAMQSLGSEDNFGLMSAGAHNVAIRAVTDRKLEAGDVIVGEITPCYRGYFAQLCRTLILGEPSDLQREKYDLLLRAQAAGLSVAKAGLPSGGIAKAVNQVIGAAGYAEVLPPALYAHPWPWSRHGRRRAYDVTEDSSPVLTEKMTMVIHPNQYIPETGYMMLGDTVVIEKNGPRSLTEVPRQLFWKAA